MKLPKLPTLAEIKKALAAAAAAASTAVVAGVITGQTAVWVTGAVAVVTAFIGTYFAPSNDDPPTI